MNLSLNFWRILQFTGLIMAEIYDLTFVHPSRWLICGPSCSGKTTFISKLIEKSDELFDVCFQKKIYCSETKPIGLFKNFELLQDFNDLNFEDSSEKINSIIVIDDKMEEAINSEKMSSLYTKYSHHYNITVLFLCQNLFS